MGFVAREPGRHPVPSCPHCGEGVPFLFRGSHVCNRCASLVDGRHFLLWPLDLAAFLQWLAAQLQLGGVVSRIGDCLWQLGTWDVGDHCLECFFRRRGPLSELERTQLSAFRNVLVFFGRTPPPEPERRRGWCVSLLELLVMETGLTVADLRPLLRARGMVRFEAHGGTLWVGDQMLGEVPVGSKEFLFLAALTRQLDHFVPYADLKHFILSQTGGHDETEEATFCQNIKSRIKKQWVPQIDLLLATTNKGDGYRLRGYVEL